MQVNYETELVRMHDTLCSEIARLTFETQRLRLAISHAKLQADRARQRAQEAERKHQADVEAELARNATARHAEEERKSQENKVHALVKKILTKANSALEVSEVKNLKPKPKYVSPTKKLKPLAPTTQPQPQTEASPPLLDFARLQSAVTSMKRKVFGISDFEPTKVNASLRNWACSMFEDTRSTEAGDCEILEHMHSLADSLVAKATAGLEISKSDLRLIQVLCHYLQDGKGGLLGFWENSG